MTDKDFDQYQEKEKKKSQEFGAPYPPGYEWVHPAASQYGYGYDPFPHAQVQQSPGQMQQFPGQMQQFPGQVQQFPGQGEEVNVSNHGFYSQFYPPYSPVQYPYPPYRPYPLQYPYTPYPPYRPYPPYPY